jgi:hypothetical protein
MATLPPTATADAETTGSARRDEALTALLAAVTSRDLQAPAMFLLEVARPFHLLIQQAFLASHPLLSPWLGNRLLVWADLLEDTGTLERALQLLASGRRGGGRPGNT